MVVWPESLIAEVAERRCIVVLGAGASAACHSLDGTRRPPTWSQFIDSLITLIPEVGDRTHAIGLARQQKYLDAAQIVRATIPMPDFDRMILREFRDPAYVPSELHDLVSQLDLKTIVTTNYDDIYERYTSRGKATDAYNVCNYYESHALNDLRSTTRSILKIHGSFSNPERVVLSLADYFRARRDFPQFYNVLDALFLSSTLILIGCGINDPDVNLLLENANISARSSHPHYAVVEDVRHTAIKQAYQETYNLRFLEYAAGQHHQVVEALKDLVARVEEYRTTHD
jgi:hypothetical protein